MEKEKEESKEEDEKDEVIILSAKFFKNEWICGYEQCKLDMIELINSLNYGRHVGEIENGVSKDTELELGNKLVKCPKCGSTDIFHKYISQEEVVFQCHQCINRFEYIANRQDK